MSTARHPPVQPCCGDDTGRHVCAGRGRRPANSCRISANSGSGIALLLGLFLGLIGGDPVSAVPRFTMGSLYLTGGLNFVPLILGFFAVTEVFVQGQRMATGTHVPSKVSVAYPSLMEFWGLRV
ncbi:MAG: tripartite tricarboxylate transporter permease, partial [Alphaproteobacteria bacterium]|nr:tripartite tricarboxylate transporter permease [Alphaproteobacteria bacterium]